MKNQWLVVLEMVSKMDQPIRQLSPEELLRVLSYERDKSDDYQRVRVMLSTDDLI